jgi:hypothetical protein
MRAGKVRRFANVMAIFPGYNPSIPDMFVLMTFLSQNRPSPT